MSILRLENISYTYDKGKKYVFKNVNYSFDKGKFYAITGMQGCGKTTLLALIAGLDKVSEGKIYFNNEDVSKIDAYNFRSKDIGVIFRNYNLLPHLTALENVVFSMSIAGVKPEDQERQALELLKKTGVADDQVNVIVSDLTYSDQLKVAIARAISYNPQIIIADEPTKRFLYKEEEEIIQIFKSLANEDGKCVILTTSSQDVISAADVVYELKSAGGKDEIEFVKDKFVRFYN